MKTCTVCGIEKPLEDFAWKKLNVRRDAQCKKCRYQKQRTPENIILQKERYSKYRASEYGKQKHKERCKKFRATENFKAAIEKYRTNNPEKRSAQIAIMNALASGKIVRPSVCSICGVECKPEAHHFDYAQPLNVLWVCKQCHSDFHWK
jgi:hypothetical protein